MKTKVWLPVFRDELVSIRYLLWGLAACAVLAGPVVRADVQVGISVGIPLPQGYAEVHVGHEHYYTHRGVFYQHGPHGYVVVRAPRGAVVRTLPSYYTRIYVGPTLYYRYGEVYYQPVQGGYVVVDPPVAQAMPPPRPVEAYQSVWVGKREFLFRDGQFFTKTADGMVWVPAPLGAVTRNLPNDARSVWFQNEEFFESDEVYFHKTPDGYEVVAPPWKK